MCRAARWLGFLLPALAVVWIFAREEGPRFMVVIGQWQSLTAGVLAIVAAGFGGYFVHRQTTLNERLERERISRRFDAEKALLPLTLSAVLAYARESVEFLKQVHALVPPGTRLLPKGVTVSARIPAPPRNPIEQAARLIETTPDNALRAYLSELLKDLQIHSARVLGMRDALAAKSGLSQSIGDVENHLLLTGAVAARCGVLFKVAREEGHVSLGPLTQAQVENGLMNVDVTDMEFPDVFKRLVDRYG